MDPHPPPPAPSAEQLFADYLDRLEGGEDVDFATFCAAWPDQAPALQRVHTRWQAMSRAFTELSQEGAATPTAASPSVDGLKQRLGSPGGRLARYVLGQEIARGAMGRIVSAWDEELRREVALKIHRGPTGDTRQQRRFLEEAQIAAQLDHPGIVPVHELGLDADGRPFFSMQLVRGRDLGQILAAVPEGRDGWSRTRVLHVLLRVCEAMAFAHEKGVVHRDLKPANIMVGRFGETYVMDWGLAHAGGGTAAAPVATLRAEIAGEDHGSPLLTRAGDVLGTPAYMAPEQAAGGQASVAPAVDVYSLGAILYHLLTGAAPYAAGQRSADDVLTALRQGPPPALPDDVPGELRAICERAMAREPAARYPGMVELADDLRAFLEVRTVRAYATGPFAELHKWIARNRTLATVAGAFVVALAASAVALTALWVRADADRQRADASAGRLQTELERSAFQRARQALQLDNSSQAADALWRAHCTGRMPRATSWALKELAARDPYVVAVLEREDRPLAFTAGGDLLLVGGTDGRLHLRDPRTLATVAAIGDRGAKLTAVASLGDGRAVAGTSRGDLMVVDLTARAVVSTRHAHERGVTALAALPDGRFASAGADGRALWWPRADGEPQVVLTHRARLNDLALRPPGDGLVAAGDDGTLVGASFDGVWQLTRRRLSSSLASVAFTESPDRVWIGDADQRIRVLDFVDATRQRVDWTRNGICGQLALARDGSMLAGGWWRTDRWSADATTRTPVALRPISRFAMAPDQRWLATSSTISGLGIVDLAPVDRRTIARAGAAGLSGDGRLVAVSIGTHARVHDVATGAVAHELPKGSNGWLALDADGSHLASNKMLQGTLSVYETASGRLLYTTPGPTGGSGFGFRFSPDGTELAFAVGRGSLRRVRTADGSLVAEYLLPGAHVLALAWSADGRWLAAAAGSRVRVYEVATGVHRDEEFRGEWPPNTASVANAVAIAADGRTIAAGNLTGAIRVRNPDGTTLALGGHDGTVWSLQFAEDDPGLLFSSGGAQGLSCWDLDSGACCFQVAIDQVSQLQVSRDGQTLSCITPTGCLLIDLAYHDRHIAGNLPIHLEAQRAQGNLAPAREQQLRTWAAEVLARPWPRWR